MRKIAIIGSAPSSVNDVPEQGSGWEIWGLGVRSSQLKAADRIFEVHKKLKGTEELKKTQEAAKRLGAELITWENYPYKEVDALNYGERYLTSSIAYMLAMAILEDVDEIGVWGVDMATDDSEYFYQAPCFEHWRGIAHGKGIHVRLPPQCPRGKWKWTYGIDAPISSEFNPTIFNEVEFSDLADYHQMRINELEEQKRIIENMIHTHNGCKQAFEKMSETARAVDAGQDIKTLKHAVVVK